ncbi:MAG: hypothetical protein IID61_15310 [SAR324 cluster bacterium]|nr:hypothetical protein [SAR324 cluster bacterium]
MKKNTTSKARLSSRKVRIKNLAKGLTSQAGLIPVVKFLDRLGFCGLVDENVPHKRGENAVYTFSDVVLLTTVGMIGGAGSLLKVVVVWSDGVLRRVGGWVRIPDDSTLVSPDTNRLIAPYFNTEPLEETTLKGKSLPVILPRVIGEKAVYTRFEAARQRGLTPQRFSVRRSLSIRRRGQPHQRRHGVHLRVGWEIPSWP